MKQNLLIFFDFLAKGIMNKSCLICFFCIICCVHISAMPEIDWDDESDNAVELDGIWYYIIDDKAYVCEYRGNQKDVVIPKHLLFDYHRHLYFDQYLHSVYKTIHVDADVVGIYHGAFRVSGIKSIDIKAVVEIGNQAFYGLSTLTDITFSDGGGATAIGREAFYDCTNLANVNWGYNCTFTTIKDGTFLHCTSLKSINFPESVETIEENAFNVCTGLTTVNFPQNLKKIAGFYKCTGLTSLTFPQSLKEISSSAFSGCTGLRDLSFPQNLETIGSNAFFDCTGLTSVNFNENLKTICTKAFYGCTGLKNVNFEQGIQEIEWNAFEKCTGLTSLTFPQSLEILQNSAFNGCTGLASVIFEGNIREVGYDAFKGCSELKTIELYNADSLTVYSRAFKGCNKIENVRCRDIGKWCLVTFTDSTANPVYYSRHLYYPPTALHPKGKPVKEIKVPSGIKDISAFAFVNADDMTRIDLPTSVESIGDFAFNSAGANIQRVRVRFRNAFEISDSTFNERAYRNTPLLVYSGCQDDFSHTRAWSYFDNISPTGDYVFTFDKIVNSDADLISLLESSGLENWDTNNDGVPSEGDEPLDLPDTTDDDYNLIWTSSNTDVVVIDGYTLTMVGPGTTTITVSVLGDDDSVLAVKEFTLTVAEKPSSAEPYKPFSTTTAYYLYNKEADLYLCPGNSYDTQASVGEAGMDMLLEDVAGENESFFVGNTQCAAYAVNTRIYNSATAHYMGMSDNGTSAYFDQESAAWYFVPQEDGTFLLSSNTTGNYLYYDGVHTALAITSDATQQGAKWHVMTREDIIGKMETATADNPVNASSLIEYADFSRNGKLRVGVWQGNPSRGGNNNNFCAEKFDCNFNVYQILTGLPNGVYKVKAQAYYREGADQSYNPTPALELRKNGNEHLYAKLYANNEETSVHSIFDEAGDCIYGYSTELGVVPNSVSHAATAFLQGLYWNELEVNVTDGTLQLGIKKDEYVFYDWTCFDSFRLYYYGPEYILGDANDSGGVEIGDITSVLTLMANPDATGYNNKAADANKSGAIEIGDITTILTIMAGE